MAATEGLPEELLALILSKLPMKSLLRIKCVQKSWYFLINSPYFIHLHRSSSFSSNQCFIVRRQKRSRHVLSFYSYETLDDLGNQTDIPASFMGDVMFSGSCDGLVCFSNNIDQILICNPTIQEFRSIFLPPPLGNRSMYSIDSVAFGSDPNTGQYKVLMVGGLYGYKQDYNGYVFDDREAWLYDFSTDTWRKTAAVIPPGPFRYKQRAISLNGAFHWCPGYGNNNSNYVLTFHMSNEVTGYIPLPDFENVWKEKVLFVSSKSQLSLVLTYFGENGEGFEIWVMTEYGVKESWTRVFNVGPRSDILQVIPFWDGQRVLIRNAARQIVSCDLQHQNLPHFPIDGIDGCCDVYPFSQSLVSVNSFCQAPFVVL